MSSIEDPADLDRLLERLNTLRPETAARWGKLTAGEMLCHLGDATASVVRPAPSEEPVRPHRFMKWLALRAPVAWPRGLPTPPSVDPHADGTKPTDFEEDRKRAIDELRKLVSAPSDSLSPTHGAFGPMSARDWYRWAYRHTDHHLRQFGL